MDRLQWLSADLPTDLPGIEIGPLDKPILERPRFAVSYIDHLDRAGLQAKYSTHSTVDPERIPEIDFVVGSAGLRQSVTTEDGKFYYLIASHVIEHIPNPIDWFADVGALLHGKGRVVLAVPDHRYCFDALRRTTTAGEWVEAALSGHSRPSPGRIFDALYNEVTHQGAIAWGAGVDESGYKRSRGAGAALEIARRSHYSAEYFDVHCWTFTPESFCNLMRDLVLAGAVDFALEAITPSHGCEFFVRLVKAEGMLRSMVAATYPAAGGRYDRLPKGFDAVGYCRFNPDVVAAEIDPNDHYLEYGLQEGRRWS